MNLQLTELQFYINNIARFLGIVVLLSERIQCHQLNTLIKCSTFFTGRLSTNHNNIQQTSDLLSNIEQYTSQQYLLLVVSPSTNTGSRLTTSTETTTLALAHSASSYVTQTNLGNTINFLFENLMINFTSYMKHWNL